MGYLSETHAEIEISKRQYGVLGSSILHLPNSILIFRNSILIFPNFILIS
jgi:hypothetical protein